MKDLKTIIYVLLKLIRFNKVKRDHNWRTKIPNLKGDSKRETNAHSPYHKLPFARCPQKWNNIRKQYPQADSSEH